MKIFCLIWLLMLTPLSIQAECNQASDGDCCKVDGDCQVYLHRTMCVLLPLNRTVSRDLDRDFDKMDPSDLPQLCGREQLQELANQVKDKRVVCRDEACGFTDE